MDYGVTSRGPPVRINKEIWVSVKCGESDTTSGLASNPTVGNAIDKLVAVATVLALDFATGFVFFLKHTPSQN